MVAIKNLTIGTKVRTSSRLPAEDRDVGVVIDVNPMSAVGKEVLVRWSHRDATWTERKALFLA
jgi:hypothetical protein